MIGIASRPPPSGVDVGRGDADGTDVAGGADTAGRVGRAVGAAVARGVAAALGMAVAVGSADAVGDRRARRRGRDHDAADGAVTAEPAEGDDRHEPDRDGHGAERPEGRRSDG